MNYLHNQKITFVESIIRNNKIINKICNKIKSATKHDTIYIDNISDQKCKKIFAVLMMDFVNFMNYLECLLETDSLTPTKLSIIVNYATINNLSVNSILNLKLDNVEIKNSQVHGKGVFSKKNIKMGDIITFYPFHVIIKNPDSLTKQDVEYFGKYVYTISNKLMIAGLPDYCDDMTYVGHMINDSSTSKFKVSYERETYTHSNCAFINILNCDNNCACVAVVATTDISIGDELFVPYGHEYWKYL